MASAEQYAQWIVQNQDKRGTPEFDTVAAAYKEAKTQGDIIPTQSNFVHDSPEPAPNPTEGNSFLGNYRAGLGKSFVDTFEGIKQGLAEAGNAGKSVGANFVSDETVAEIQADVDERAKLDQPLMDTGGGMLGNITGQAVQVAAPASILGRAGVLSKMANNPLLKYASSGAEGAAFAGSQPVVSGESRGRNAAVGAIGGAVGQGLANGVGKLAAPSAGISDDVATLANRARELDIPLRADQVVNSKPLNVVSSALDYVPFSGASASKEAQGKAFNRAVSRTIGENTDNLSSALKQADARLSQQFDDVLKTTAVRADEEFIDGLSRITADARNEMTDAQFSVLSRQMENVMSKIKDGDVIDADAAYNIKKGLDRIGKSNDTTLAHYAKEMRSTLMDALNRSLPDGGESFRATRRQYANMRELEKLIPRGADVDISPARLANARGIRSQDLGELADIAAQFLKGRVGDSGTAQRAGVYGALGAGTMIDPTSTAIGLTIGRIANSAMGSNRLSSYLVNGVPALQNSQIPNRLLPAVGASLAVGNQ